MTLAEHTHAILAADGGTAPLHLVECTAHPANWSKLRRGSTQAITLHCTHGAEGQRAAENSAAEFRKPLKPAHSCHFFVDSDSVVLSVPRDFVAWHCGRSGNARTVGVELCGSADQTRAQWLDANSLPTLRIAARLVAYLCSVYQLPAVLVDATGLRVGVRGITTHAAVGGAWGETDHYDPGLEFPRAEFVEAVASLIADGRAGLV